MKTKYISLLGMVFITLSFSHPIQAQFEMDETDLIQSIFGLEKKAIIAEFIGIDSENTFWTLYDEYETKRKELGKERLALLMIYVENYDNLDDDKYDEVIADIISLRKSTDKLVDQYYKKIKKTSGSKISAQFFQLEGYFLIQIRAAILEEIPYIGEFDN